MAKRKNKSAAAEPELVVVLPGDNVTSHVFADDATAAASPKAKKPPKLGPGLRYDAAKHQVYATLAGRLISVPNNTGSGGGVFFVRQNYKHRYRPAVQDRVVGIIEERVGSDGDGGDLFRVNIAAAHPAVLSSLAFEGATKRNRPALASGQVVYARVVSLLTRTSTEQQSSSSHYHEPLSLSCKLGPHDVGVPRKDWMTAEGVYGELRGGTLCRISTGLARELLHPDNVVLQCLSKLQFELAIGVNGFLWIHSSQPEYTILIQNAILNSEVLSPEQVRSMVKSLMYTVEKQLQQDRDAMEE